MRRRFAVVFLLVVALPLPLFGGWDLSDPCRAWYCTYEGSSASCTESQFGMGQWVTCTARSRCMWSTDENGNWTRVCNTECDGEYCMWV